MELVSGSAKALASEPGTAELERWLGLDSAAGLGSESAARSARLERWSGSESAARSGLMSVPSCVVSARRLAPESVSR